VSVTLINAYCGAIGTSDPRTVLIPSSSSSGISGMSTQQITQQNKLSYMYTDNVSNKLTIKLQFFHSFQLLFPLVFVSLSFLVISISSSFLFHNFSISGVFLLFYIPAVFRHVSYFSQNQFRSSSSCARLNWQLVTFWLVSLQLLYALQ